MRSKKADSDQPRLDEQAIVALVAAREVAWNAGDTVAYAQLLTEDADIVSATGRPARGREAVLKLYAEQHANAYAGVRTHTTVTHVRMIGRDVALADVSYALEGGKVDSIRRGSMAFVLRKDAGRWRIAAIRSIPERST
jgi:uncharacterized protein (TIGR02246 family)